MRYDSNVNLGVAGEPLLFQSSDLGHWLMLEPGTVFRMLLTCSAVSPACAVAAPHHNVSLHGSSLHESLPQPLTKLRCPTLPWITTDPGFGVQTHTSRYAVLGDGA